MKYLRSMTIEDFQFYPKLRNYIESKSNISFSVIFGSYAKHSQNQFSDLDIGIYITKEIEILEIGEMISNLEDITKLKIDLLVLNDLYKERPTLAYSIVSNWHIIFNRNISEIQNFKTNTFLSYFDHESLRNQNNLSIKKRISMDKIGERNFA